MLLYAIVTRSHFYRVPEDVSVVGLDDYIFATLCNPPLTTFRVNLEEMAKEIVDAMSRKLKDDNYQNNRKVISGNLVVRESVRNIANG